MDHGPHPDDGAEAGAHTADAGETAAESARQLRGVLAELDDPDSELTASAATRHRLEGAAHALEQLSRPES